MRTRRANFVFAKNARVQALNLRKQTGSWDDSDMHGVSSGAGDVIGIISFARVILVKPCDALPPSCNILSVGWSCEAKIQPIA